jgi:hypothetical protein
MTGATYERQRLIANYQFGSGVHGSFVPTTWYLALSKTTPNEDGSNFTEPSGMNYARVAAFNDASGNFGTAVTANGITTLAIATTFTFPNPSGDWGTLVYYGWFTASTGGTVQFFDVLDSPLVVKSTNTPVAFAPGTLVMQFN